MEEANKKDILFHILKSLEKYTWLLTQLSRVNSIEYCLLMQEILQELQAIFIMEIQRK